MNNNLTMANSEACVISIRHKLEVEVQNKCEYIKRCIYKVPEWLKDQECDGNDKTPYVPELISFGPYHWGDPTLAEMETHKLRCLQTMLTRERRHVKPFIDAMCELEHDVRACYQGPVNDKLDGKAFVEMLVLDGCFMLEFLRVKKSGIRALEYEPDDPIFSKRPILQVIGRDVMKLENQLPIMVLEKLFSIQYNITTKHISDLVLCTLTPRWIVNEKLTSTQLKTMRKEVGSDPNNTMRHCLDIFRFSLLYKPPSDSDDQIIVPADDNANVPVSNQEGQHDQPPAQLGGSSTPLSESDDLLRSPNTYAFSVSSAVEEQSVAEGKKRHPMSYLVDMFNKIRNCRRRAEPSYETITDNSQLMVYCVKDLREAGVKLKTRNSRSFLDITFDNRRGLLEIPPIRIDGATKTVLLNLIAYEQCHYNNFWEMPITDYVAFMDNLVNSAADVGHLHRAGIIVHQLGSDEEVSSLFNRLVKKAFVNWEVGRKSELYKELNVYCTHRRHRWFANLRHDYLKNPWVIFSICAAIFLFFVTVVQTFYAVFAYHHPPKSH